MREINFLLLKLHVIINIATATRATFHPQLQHNCQKLLLCHRREKTATWLHGVLAKFADRKLLEYSEFSMFSHFPGVTLPAPDMLRKNLYVRRQ